MKIKAVMFDLIGTTVVEKSSKPITDCFVNAFKSNGISISPEFVRKNRGKDKTDIIMNILTELLYPLDMCEPILTKYRTNLENRISDFSENIYLREILSFLKGKEIKIGLGTGLSRNFLNKIIKHFNWESIGFDYTGTSEETGQGRPNPEMIFDMMNKFNINNREFLKVGDTVVDIQEGKNAKVLTAAILSGTQSNEELIREEPDFIIKKLYELKDLIV